MARFEYQPLMAETGEFSAVYGNATWIDSESFNEGAVSYDDIFGQARISLIGSGMEATGNWWVSAGHVTSATFWYSWQTAIAVKGLDFDASVLDEIMRDHGPDALFAKLMSGDDKIIGSDIGDHLLGGRGADVIKGGDGKDVIDAGQGNDKIEGGAGSDQFFFASHLGKDIITDFDANGGGNRQDYVQVTGDDPFTIHARGHDTVLEFSDGATLTLKDVDRSDFSRADDVRYVEF